MKKQGSSRGKKRMCVGKILGICILTVWCLTGCHSGEGALSQNGQEQVRSTQDSIQSTQELSRNSQSMETFTSHPSPAPAEETSTGLSLKSLEPDCKIICKKKTEYGKEDDRYVSVVFQHRKNKRRILYVIKEFKDGSYQLLAKNSSIIMKEDEGGMMGDPFLTRDIKLKRNRLDIQFYGGSGWRWLNQYTFRIQKDKILLTRYRHEYRFSADEMYGEIRIAGGSKSNYYPQKGIFTIMKKKGSRKMIEDHDGDIQKIGKLVSKKITVEKETIALDQFDADSLWKKVNKLEKKAL